MNFIRRLNSSGNIYFSNQSFQIWWLISGKKKHTKVQLNISKIVAARVKKHRDMECEYHYTRPITSIRLV